VYRLFLALRYLRSRLVNLISIGGVMMGVGVLIVVVSIMDGFQDRVRTTVRGNLSHMVLTPRKEAVPFEPLARKLQERFPEIVGLTPQLHSFIFYEYQSNKLQVLGEGNRAFHQLNAVGIRWQTERQVSDLADYLLAVRDPERPFHDEEAISRELRTVLVSRAFAERFMGVPFEGEGWDWNRLLGMRVHVLIPKIQKNETGDYVLDPSTYNLVVSGVFDGMDQIADLQTCYLDMDAMRSLLGLDPQRQEYSEIRVKLSDYELAESLKHRLVESELLDGFVVETWEDQRADFLQAVDNEKMLLVIVLSFIVLLGGFIILATLTLTVVEKTRDIGIVAALGGSRTGILRIFLFNGLLIGVIGSLLGLGLGWLFTDNVNAVRAGLESVGVNLFPPNVYHFREVPTIWHWPSVFAIMCGSVLVAVLAGLPPALRAARLDPISALRYE
jgi:lipoprotein-releasing system permease protein